MLMSETHIWEARVCPYLFPAGIHFYSYNDAKITLMYWWEYHITLWTSFWKKTDPLKCVTQLIQWWNIISKSGNSVSVNIHPCAWKLGPRRGTQWKVRAAVGRGGCCRLNVSGRQKGSWTGREGGGCGEDSDNHEELHNGWGRGGEGLSGWGCFLWITCYIYEALEQQHANEILDKTTEQKSSASPLLRYNFCKPVPFLSF